MKSTILKPEDKMLRQPCEEINKKDLKSKNLQLIIDTMLAFVYGNNNKGKKQNKKKPMTVGLSANQIGILKQISIVDLAIGNKKINDIHVLINPKIIWHSKTYVEKAEGCVNLPNIWGEIKRYKEVKVQAIDRSGNTIIIHVKNWPAVLLQHEIDHLQGKLFIDRLTDPTKAHLVSDDEMSNYRKKSKNWDTFIDVSKLTKKL